MSRAMVRWTVAGALTGALAMVAGGGFAAADAAPSGSPYAGSYTGTIAYPRTGGEQGGGGSWLIWNLDVSVSSAGKIAGAANFFGFGPYGVLPVSPEDGTATGSLSTKGTIRLSVSDGSAHESLNATFTVDASGVFHAYDSRKDAVVTLTPK